VTFSCDVLPSLPLPHPPPQGWVDPSILVRTRALLQAARLPTEPPAGMTAQAFKDLMAVDKKVGEAAGRRVVVGGWVGGWVGKGGGGWWRWLLVDRTGATPTAT
jgi:hypothetical protein